MIIINRKELTLALRKLKSFAHYYNLLLINVLKEEVSNIYSG